MASKETLQHSSPFVDFLDQLIRPLQAEETIAFPALNQVPMVLLTRDEYLGHRGSPSSRSLIESSIDFVSDVHKDHTRHNGNSYLEGHIFPVALIAKRLANSSSISFGKYNEITALAHDTNEDGHGRNLFQDFLNMYGNSGGKVVSLGVMSLSKKGYVSASLAREFTASDIALGRRTTSMDQPANLTKVKLSDEQYARNLDEIPEAQKLKDKILVIKQADRISNLLEDLWALQQVRRQQSVNIRLDNAQGKMVVKVSEIVSYVNEARTLLYPVFAKRPALVHGCKLLLGICTQIQEEVSRLISDGLEVNRLLVGAFEPIPNVEIQSGSVYRSKPSSRRSKSDVLNIS